LALKTIATLNDKFYCVELLVVMDDVVKKL
jgi:hypothetical protein